MDNRTWDVSARSPTAIFFGLIDITLENMQFFYVLKY